MFRGIPTVKSSAAKQDTGRDDALAKARAAVEAESKKEGSERSGDTEKADVEATEKRKRAREDDGAADADREAKKIDTKDDPVTVS
jgi:hypothetical protein